jgi:hypothetical protein
MEYLFLIMETGDTLARLPDEQLRELYQTHIAVSAKMDAAGVKRSGGPLQPPGTATTVRTTDGTDRFVTDGPYAEAKEHLGGWYLVEAADLDEALDWARQLPLPPGLCVEVRPVQPTGAGR